VDLVAVMVVDDGSPNATVGAALGAVESDSRSEVLAGRWVTMRHRLALDVWRVGIDVPWNQPESKYSGVLEEPHGMDLQD